MNISTDSIFDNLTQFTDKLNDIDFIKLTNYVCRLDDDSETKPDGFIAEFISEFFGDKEWEEMISDERGEQKYFFKSSASTRDLARTIRIGLMQKGFIRLSKNTKSAKPVVTVKQNKLSKQDKDDLIDILVEHKAMLEYQLEDESSIIQTADDVAEGKQLVKDKKRYVKVIEKLDSLKLF